MTSTRPSGAAVPGGRPLHRHQLAWLTAAGWERVGAGTWDEVSRDCLDHWRRHELPLVVTRQPAPGSGEAVVALGLPAPLRWERRRIPLSVPRVDVASWGDFPEAQQLHETLPPEQRPAWQGLCAALEEGGLVARIHGSHGWQLITGLGCVRPGSDIDLALAVGRVEQADAAAAILQQAHGPHLSLDGELSWPDGQAVAWREWQIWRAGRVKSILVKHLSGHRLVHDLAIFGPHSLSEVPA